MAKFEHLDNKLNLEEKVIYTLGKLGNLGYLQIFIENDFQEDLEVLITKFKLEDIFIKNRKEWLKDKNRETTLVLEENGNKLFIDLSLEDIGLDLYQSKARQLIKDNSVNREVLIVLGHNGEYAINIASVAKRVTTHLLDDNNFNKNIDLNTDNAAIVNLKKDVMKETFENFFKILVQTKEEYDVIVLDLSDYNLNKLENFELAKDHLEIIKGIQENNLKEGGMLIFITNAAGFVLDRYIRPGADKLTKKTNEIRKLKLNHSYAFYN